MVDVNIILHRYQSEPAFQQAYDYVLQALFECVRDKERNMVDKIHRGELALRIESFQENFGPFVYIAELSTLENTKFATATAQSNQDAFTPARQMATTVLSETSNIDDNFWKDVSTAVKEQTQKKLSPTSARKAKAYSAAAVTDQYSSDIEQAQALRQRFENCENRNVAVTRIAFKPFPLKIIKGADSIAEAQELYKRCYAVYTGLWNQVDKFKLAKDPSSLTYLEALSKVLAETPEAIHKSDIVADEFSHAIRSWYTKALPLLGRGFYYQYDLSLDQYDLINTLVAKSHDPRTNTQFQKNSSGDILLRRAESDGVQSLVQDTLRLPGGFINFSIERIQGEEGKSPLDAYSQASSSFSWQLLLRTPKAYHDTERSNTIIKPSIKSAPFTEYNLHSDIKYQVIAAAGQATIDRKGMFSKFVTVPGSIFAEMEYSDPEKRGPILTRLETDSYLIYQMICGVDVDVTDDKLMATMHNEVEIRNKHQETTQKLSAYMSAPNEGTFTALVTSLRDFESNYGRYLLLPSFAGDRKQAQKVLDSIQEPEKTLKGTYQSKFEETTFSYTAKLLHETKPYDLEASEVLINRGFTTKRSLYSNLKWIYLSGGDVTDTWREYIFNKEIPGAQQAKNLDYIVNLLLENKRPMLPKGLLFKTNAELHQLLVLIGKDSELMYRFIQAFINPAEYNSLNGPNLTGTIQQALDQPDNKDTIINEADTLEEKSVKYILGNFKLRQFQYDVGFHVFSGSKALFRLTDTQLLRLAALDMTGFTAYELLTSTNSSTSKRQQSLSQDSLNGLLQIYQKVSKNHLGLLRDPAVHKNVLPRLYSSPNLNRLSGKQLVDAAVADKSGELAKTLLISNRRRGVGKKITGADIPTLVEAYFASCANENDAAKREKAEKAKYDAIKSHFTEPKKLIERLKAWWRGDNRVAQTNQFFKEVLEDNPAKQTENHGKGISQRQADLLIRLFKDGINKSRVQQAPKYPSIDGPVSRSAAVPVSSPIDITAVRVAADDRSSLTSSSGSPRIDLSVFSNEELFAKAYFSADADEKLFAKLELLKETNLDLGQLNEYARKLDERALENLNIKDHINIKIGVTSKIFKADSALAELIAHPNKDADDDVDDKKLLDEITNNGMHASNDMLAAYYLATPDMRADILRNADLCRKLLSTQSPTQAHRLMTNGDAEELCKNQSFIDFATTHKQEVVGLLVTLNNTARLKNEFDPAFNFIINQESTVETKKIPRDQLPQTEAAPAIPETEAGSTKAPEITVGSPHK